MLASGDTIDAAKYDEMAAEKKISGRLKASKEQIFDDLSGVMSQLQRQMMRMLLSDIDELNPHIKELDSQIDNHMKPDEKKAVDAVKAVTGLGVDSSRIIISVIGTDMDVAVAHSMLIAVYHILKYGVEYKDLGSEYYNQFNKERKINSLLKKLKTLGWDPSEAMAVQNT